MVLVDPGDYRRCGFQAHPGLELSGVPPEYFHALSFGGELANLLLRPVESTAQSGHWDAPGKRLDSTGIRNFARELRKAIAVLMED